MQPPLVALDIGSTKIACAVGLPNEQGSGFELMGSSLVAYPLQSETWLSDPLLVGRTIEQALEATAVGMPMRSALVAVSPPSLAVERVRAAIGLGDEPTAVRARDVDRVTNSALYQALAIDREALWVEPLGFSGNGFEGIRDPRGLSATRLSGDFLILTMPLAVRHSVTQAVEAAGLDVGQLSFTLPTLLAAMGNETEIPRHVLMIDVGGLTIESAVCVEGLMQSLTCIPWGGTRLASLIAQRLGVTLPQAITWSLEGNSCPQPQVQSLIAQQRQALSEVIRGMLKDRPKPEAAWITGRGALIDGFVEWVELAFGIPATLCRSPRTSRLVDLPRQVALGPVVGMLERVTRKSDSVRLGPTAPFLNRLIEKTRSVLTEYF
ncbi:MAG: hypothetical protein HYY57_06055 [Candidatus Omnitrophica bacterium]|nr:hypothetical protein [Candidatus Omnitrophota bacterium]